MINPADADHRCAHARPHRGDERKADVGRVRLRGRRIDGAHGNVVRPLPLRLKRLLKIMGRLPHDPPGAEQLFRDGHRHILLADMDPFRSNRERDVEAIIDDEWDAGRFGDTVNANGTLEEGEGRGCFVP